MLKEKIIYDNHLPIKVTTVNLNNYPMHLHDDIEVMYVLEGSVLVKNGYFEQVLSEGDVFLFNKRELHSLARTEEDNMVMMLHINISYFTKYYNTLQDSFFVMESRDDKPDSVESLRTLMASIMMEMLQKGYRYEEKVIESVHNLLSCLISDFTFDDEQDGRDGERSRSEAVLAARLHRVIEYMYENYGRKLTLNEIADIEELSLYYLSHVIKDTTGMSFQDLLSYIRVEASEKLVLGSTKRIGAIAEEVGFSAVRYYIKHFGYWYGMHPLEYRKKYGGKIVHHRLAAEFVRCAPVKIEGSIRKHKKEVYADYVDRFKTKPVMISVDSKDVPKSSIIEARGLAKTMERDVNRILAEPFLKFKGMQEHLMSIGSNYAITTKCAPGQELNSLSIVLYNVDEAMEESLNVIGSEEELLGVVKSYITETEFLIRFSGFRGTYRVLRYRMDKDVLVKKISDAVNMKGVLDARERFVNELSAEPTVYTGQYKSSEIMSLRSAFSGIGMEIILIDRVE
ncbi:MAG: helix-turn-helix transcriptional regulator [Eubacterium sp.]|nr:helix-turn-helix transcriptional regulator [Candidatus Colimonas fimequi]